jgi:hypothetical protein
MPTRRIKFKMWPIPKYLKIKKVIIPQETKNPLRVFINIVDIGNRIAAKRINKKSGTAPKVVGSI